MRARTRIYITGLILALFVSCGTFGRKSASPMSTVDAVKESCSKEAIDPAIYRNLSDRQAVPAKSYHKVVKSNRDCVESVYKASFFNEQIAKENSPDSFSEDLQEAAAGSFITLILAAILVLAL